MENNLNQNFNGRDPYDFKTACIIVDKVYAHCQQRECFENVTLPIPECGKVQFVGLTFNPGEIVDGSLIITDIPNRPNFRRVRFTVRITFIATFKNLKTGEKIAVKGVLPDIDKDIVLYIPDARDEFTFQIVIETSSKLLTEPFEDKHQLVFAVGTFIITKVVGRVQLHIPEIGFCPEPPECEPFLPDEICEEFDLEPFPDFFPPQFEDMPYSEFF